MILNTIGFILTFALSVISTPLTADAQQTGKVHRIGFLIPAASTLAPLRLEPFRQGLNELGYVEGRNVVIEARWAEGKIERLPELAAELVRLKVDIIVAAATPAVQAAKNATSTIPIVMVDPGDPVRTGLVTSLARPGGNVTGLSSVTPDIAAKQLQLLTEAVSNVASVAFLWNSANPAAGLALKETQAAARTLGVKLHSIEVRSPEDFEGSFGAIARERVSALMVFSDPLTFTHRRRIMDFAARNRLPTMSGAREFVDTGGVMSYGPNFPQMFRYAATYVHKILRGTKPADLPVEQPTKFELVINLKTAKALGLTIPQHVLIRADKVIE